MGMLIAGRAIQGLGAGGLIPLAVAAIGDIIPPRSRGKWQGVTGVVFAASSVLGPAVGGWLTDNASWRWCFFVNLPLAAVALVVVWFGFVRRPAPEKHTIDYVGALLLDDRRRCGSPWRSLGRDAVPVELSDHHRPLPRRHRALDRLRPLGAAHGGAHPSARPLRGEDVRGRHRRLVLGRSGDVRRDHLRAALRPARARRERVVLGRRAHPAHARDHHDEHRRRADRLPDRPLPRRADGRPAAPRASASSCSRRSASAPPSSPSSATSSSSASASG